jgi:hypothetical protein
VLPARITLLGLLQGGDMVDHGYSDDEGSSTPNHPTDSGAPQAGPVGGPGPG